MAVSQMSFRTHWTSTNMCLIMSSRLQQSQGRDMQGLLCLCKGFLQRICAMLHVYCIRRYVNNTTEVTWYEWGGQLGPNASDPKIETGAYVSGTGRKLIESLTGWWWRLGMRRVDRTAHRTCRPAQNTAPRRKCHFRSHMLRQSKHKVNAMQNHNIILRHTNTGHASLLLLLLPRWVHNLISIITQDNYAATHVNCMQELCGATKVA